ncbi:hypothetical protein [Clostridium pasteurianum]|uniref:Uncharacterized protein n=1 Tax=Clostridium pasteurianum BC1 TaxID=86416 RepID=R4KDQ9_CLOPA|nr:hypothetical protein [Clostridium pasteurianum]AGK97755.1 hypothetical protein Clopa_2917 [Clostridium pasteurianum BC1]
MTTVLLLIIGILLIAVNIKAVKKENTSFKNVFHKASTNVKDYDVEIGKLRKEFAETILELQGEIESLKNKLQRSPDVNYKNIHNSDIENIYNKGMEDNILENNELDSIEISHGKNTAGETRIIDENDKINKNKYIDNNEINNDKVDDIEKLTKEGLSVEGISERLGIGKGEILLIQKLYIK